MSLVSSEYSDKHHHHDLSAQGSGLCARQAKGSSHAPEIPTPTPAINLRFNIDGLTKGRERVGGLLVGEVEEEPE